MNTQEVCQCPICFDTISDKKNNITTECGHKFHASCLMTNVIRNGFNCPCCRAVMATPEYPEYKEEQEDHSDSDSSTFQTFPSYSESDSGSYEFESDTDEECEQYKIPISTLPTVDYMTIEYMINQFVESAGITIKDLIGAIVFAIISSDVKYQIDMDIRNTYNNIWNQIDVIIENYKNHQEIMDVSPVVEEEPVRETIHPSIVIAKNIKKDFTSVHHLDQILEDLQLKMDFTDLDQIRKDLQLNYPSH